MTEPTAPTPGRRLPLALGVAVVALGLAVLAWTVAAGSGGRDDDAPSTTAPVTTSAPASTTVADDGSVAAGTTAPTTPEEGLGEGVAPERDGRRPLRGFSEVAATITAGDGRVCEVCLLAATTEAQRARGLMEVTDPELGGYDGMVFVYPEEVAGGFWMRNTPSPLSIAYFDSSGALVSTVDMAPCADAPTCPSYPPEGPFRFAIEVLQGDLPEVGVTGAATFRLDGTSCPVAAPG